MAQVMLVATTPNPEAMKFTLDVPLDGMFNVTSPEDAAAIPVVKTIFDAGGVAAVFGTDDFVTVTRTEGADWSQIEHAVRAAVAEHL